MKYVDTSLEMQIVKLETLRGTIYKQKCYANTHTQNGYSNLSQRETQSCRDRPRSSGALSKGKTGFPQSR